MYKLHAFYQSGNCYKAALMLELLGQRWEPVFVDSLNGETRSPAFRESVNEMGEAPVLDADGVRMSQSGVILTYLAEKHGRFGGKDEAHRREVLRWLLYDNHKFTSYYATYRWLLAFNDKPPEPEVLAFLRGRFQAAFALVDKRLEQSKFIVADEPTIADVSMVGYLFFPVEETGYDVRAQHPAIARWLDRVQSLPGWRAPSDCLPGKCTPPRWR